MACGRIRKTALPSTTLKYWTDIAQTLERGLFDRPDPLHRVLVCWKKPTSLATTACTNRAWM